MMCDRDRDRDMIARPYQCNTRLLPCNRRKVNRLSDFFYISRLDQKMPENIRQRRRHPAGGRSTFNRGEETLKPLFVRMECVSLYSLESEIVGNVELEVDIKKTRRSG